VYTLTAEGGVDGQRVNRRCRRPRRLRRLRPRPCAPGVLNLELFLGLDYSAYQEVYHMPKCDFP